MSDRLLESVPGKLDGELYPEGARADAAATLGEYSRPVAQAASDAAAAGQNKGAAANAPACRSVGDEESNANVVCVRVGECVTVERSRSIERHADVRQALDAASDSKGRSGADTERIDGDPATPPSPAELEHIDVRETVSRLVVVRLELRRRDVGSHEILQRMLEEVQGLGVQPIERDRDELPPGLGVAVRLSNGGRGTDNRNDR